MSSVYLVRRRIKGRRFMVVGSGVNGNIFLGKLYE
jgi:hypothetical protein